jgi:hypothetical protein
MNKYQIPPIFRRLQAEGCLQENDIVNTRDGFFLAYRSLSDLLAQKSTLDFLDSEGRRLDCNRFFDDWFLYAVPEENSYTYSLLKLREQEHDMGKDTPADGDVPGVTICFISFACQILLDCLCDPTDENRRKLNAEINRVVARRGQRHHDALKRYFVNPESDGAYLVASVYTKYIASFAENGHLAVPDHYNEITQQYARRKNSKKFGRLPRFIELLNQEAGHVVCDNRKIYIHDPANPDRYECAAILATHTGNTSVYSFAAEVEYHARFLIPIARFQIPLIGKSLYASAIRADMSVGDAEFQGSAPFYRPDSRIVMKQYDYHKNKEAYL